MVLEGKGSFGIVFSSPRIPISSEKYEDIIELNQVSKLLFNVEDKIYYPETQENISKTYDNVLKLIKEYPHIFSDENFILPIKGGYINKADFVSKYNSGEFGYGYEWISKSLNVFKILSQLISNKNEIFQVVYDKGIPLKYEFDTFFLKMINIYNLVELCNKNGFYFDDLKYGNLIVHNDKIKIIDFEEPINLNLSEEEYIKTIGESKFYNIMYFPYDTISNLLLYEFTGYIRKIGFLKNNNYYRLLQINTYEYIENVEFKFNAFNILINFWDKHLKNYTIEMDAYNLEAFDLNDLNTNNFNFKNHFDSGNSEKMLNDNKNKIKINLEMFIESIETLYISYMIKQHNNNYNKNNIIKIMDIFNEIFILNKNFIKLTKKTNKDIISSLLSNINIYSYGFIFLDWLRINKTKINDLVDRDNILKRIINIVVNCCINFVIYDNKLYILDRNYVNLNQVLNF